VHLEDFSRAFRFSHMVRLHDEGLSDLGLHGDLLDEAPTKGAGEPDNSQRAPPKRRTEGTFDRA
jgi:hypothetical protein